MTEELKSALKEFFRNHKTRNEVYVSGGKLEFFRNHKTRNEVYVSGGKLFYDRGAAESHSAGTVRYTRAEVEALPVTAGKEAGTEKPARKPAEKKKSATKAPAPEKEEAPEAPAEGAEGTDEPKKEE